MFVNGLALSKLMAIDFKKSSAYPQASWRGVLIEPHASGKGATLVRMSSSIAFVWYDQTAEIDRPLVVLHQSYIRKFLQPCLTNPSQQIGIQTNPNLLAFLPTTDSATSQPSRQKFPGPVTTINLGIPPWKSMIGSLGRRQIEELFVYQKRFVDSINGLCSPHPVESLVMSGRMTGDSPIWILSSPDVPVFGLCMPTHKSSAYTECSIYVPPTQERQPVKGEWESVTYKEPTEAELKPVFNKLYARAPSLTEMAPPERVDTIERHVRWICGLE